MNIVKEIIGFYTQNWILNTIILIVLAGIVYFIWQYRKLKALALISSVKAEFEKTLKGSAKLDAALNWIIRQNFYKNSILRYIPLKLIKWLINTVFQKNKEQIEATK